MPQVLLVRYHLRHIADMHQVVRLRYHLRHTDDRTQVILVRYHDRHTTDKLQVILLRYHLRHIADMPQVVRVRYHMRHTDGTFQKVLVRYHWRHERFLGAPRRPRHSKKHPRRPSGFCALCSSPSVPTTSAPATSMATAMVRATFSQRKPEQTGEYQFRSIISFMQLCSNSTDDKRNERVHDVEIELRDECSRLRPALRAEASEASSHSDALVSYPC